LKIVFIQRDSFVRIGVEQLAAILKQRGYPCEIFLESGEKDLIGSALDSGADLFAFSVTTGNEQWVLSVAAKLKARCSTPILLGGPHPTFFPKIVEERQIDFICRGEGEEALPELLEALEHRPDQVRLVKNIWSKDADGKVHSTEVRPLVDDLDSLPFPDFDIYAKYAYMVPYQREMYPMVTGRGCPKNCSYCFNKAYKDLYKKKGKTTRRRSPENVIRELIWAKDKIGIRQVNFVDDAFLSDPGWVHKFAGLYREEVRLPFVINVEATQAREDLIKVLGESGCVCARMGLETGSETLRYEVLNKKVPDRKIREAAGFIKRYGMKLTTNNILGLPGETIDQTMETYILNKEIGSDLVWCALLQPYPGTAIDAYVRKGGFLKEHAGDEPVLQESLMISSVIAMENEKEILNLQKLMQIFLILHVPPSLVRQIIKLPNNAAFHLMYRMSFVYSKMKVQKLRVLPVLRLALHSLSYMKGG